MKYPNGIYETRISRACSNLADAYFTFSNVSNLLEITGGGCLDAPDQIPSGSVKDYGKKERFILPSIIARTREDSIVSEERISLAKRLISELLTTTKI